LPGLERLSVPKEAGVEVGEDPEDTLLELAGDLFLGELFCGDGDGDVDFGRGDGKSDEGELVVLSGVDRDLVGLVGLEVRGGDPDLVVSCRKVFEEEEADAVSCLDALGLAAQRYKCGFGIEDDASVNVADGAADGGGGW
jgi:hypothetical protein